MKKKLLLGHRQDAELSDEEIEDLSHGLWMMDCSHIQLKPRNSDASIFSGPGSISQDKEGQLRYKFYAPQPGDGEDLWRDNYGEPGEIIPESAYYDLTAVDAKGREWHAERILRGSMSIGTDGAPVFSGWLKSIACEGELPEKVSVKGSTLSFTVFDQVEIPSNTITSERRRVSGWSHSRHEDLAAWSFKAAGFEFLLSNDRKDRLQIKAIARQDELATYFGERVLETLFFVLGRPLYPTITRYRCLRQTKCILNSRRIMLRGARHNPPFDIGMTSHPKTGKLTAEPYRKLFLPYFSHILSYDEQRHPLWAQLNAVYEASAGTFIDAQALTLAVAIESILGSEFADIGKPSAQDIERVKEALAYWDDWEGDKTFKQRVKGSVSQIKSVRAGDKMKELAARGAISSKSLKAWQRLRNANAHNYQNNSLKPEEFHELLGVVQTLFYQLIFHAIGYRGVYRDYGSEGWPLRRYPPTKPERATVKEIATE